MELWNGGTENVVAAAVSPNPGGYDEDYPTASSETSAEGLSKARL